MKASRINILDLWRLYSEINLLKIRAYTNSQLINLSLCPFTVAVSSQGQRVCMSERGAVRQELRMQFEPAAGTLSPEVKNFT